LSPTGGKLHGMHRIYDEMEAIEKPIVVAHHAPCVGGGLELSLSCDFRLAAKECALLLSGGQVWRAARLERRQPACHASSARIGLDT